MVTNNVVKSTKAKTSNGVKARTFNKTDGSRKKTKSRQEMVTRASSLSQKWSDLGINDQKYPFSNFLSLVADYGVVAQVDSSGEVLLAFPKIRKWNFVRATSRDAINRIGYCCSELLDHSAYSPYLVIEDSCLFLESLIKSSFKPNPNRIIHIFRRCGYDYMRNKICIDCGLDNKIVEIDAKGYQIVEDSPTIFVRDENDTSSVIPHQAANKDWVYKLADHINLEEDDLKLLICYLVYHFFPRNFIGSKSILALKGQKASEKIKFAKIIKEILDPSRGFISIPVQKNEQDVYLYTEKDWLLGCSNIEDISDPTSAVFCTIPISRESSRRRKDVWTGFCVDLPKILGAIFAIVSDVMRELPDIKLDTTDLDPEVQDFARVGIAVEKSLGWYEGAFCNIYERNLESSVVTNFYNDPTGAILVQYLKDKLKNISIGRISWNSGSRHTIEKWLTVLKNQCLKGNIPNFNPANIANFLLKKIWRFSPSLSRIGIFIRPDKSGKPGETHVTVAINKEDKFRKSIDLDITPEM